MNRGAEKPLPWWASSRCSPSKRESRSSILESLEPRILLATDLSVRPLVDHDEIMAVAADVGPTKPDVPAQLAAGNRDAQAGISSDVDTWFGN